MTTPSASETYLGEFFHISEDTPCGTSFRLQVRPADLLFHWGRNSIVAGFIGTYSTYSDTPLPPGEPDPNYNSINTIVNEVIENAAKFSPDRTSHIDIGCRVYRRSSGAGPIAKPHSVLLVECANHAAPHHVLRLEDYAGRLFEAYSAGSEAVGELIRKQLLMNAANPKTEESSIGLFTIAQSYGCPIGVRIYRKGQFPLVTVRVYVELAERAL